MAGTYRSRDNGIKDSFHYASHNLGEVASTPHKKKKVKKAEIEREVRQDAHRAKLREEELEFEKKKQDIKTKASAERTYKNTLAKKYASDKYKEAKKKVSGDLVEVRNKKPSSSKKGSKKK